MARGSGAIDSFIPHVEDPSRKSYDVMESPEVRAGELGKGLKDKDACPRCAGASGQAVARGQLCCPTCLGNDEIDAGGPDVIVLYTDGGPIDQVAVKGESDNHLIGSRESWADRLICPKCAAVGQVRDWGFGRGGCGACGGTLRLDDAINAMRVFGQSDGTVALTIDEARALLVKLARVAQDPAAIVGALRVFVGAAAHSDGRIHMRASAVGSQVGMLVKNGVIQ